MLAELLLFAAVQSSNPAGVPKTLPPETVQAYLAGEGMGLAKPAELNHYPGPKHVRELSKQLGLTPEQQQRTNEIFATMKEEAVRLGREILDRETQLEEMFRTQTMDEKGLVEMTSQIARLQGELRAVHLRAHLQMKSVLSAEQIHRYGLLRH